MASRRHTPKRARTGKSPAPARRLRYTQFPEPEETIEFPWVRSRPLHARRCFGEIALSIVTGQAWREVMDPTLALWEQRRDFRADGRRKPGPKRLYSPRDCEIIELLRRIGGFTTYKDTLDWLCAPHRRRARRLLNFEQQRQAPRRGNPDHFRGLGVPVSSVLSDYRKDIGQDNRQKLWERFEDRLRELYLAGSGRERRILHLDGFNVRVPGVCPKFDRRTGEIVNAERITVPDGGYQTPYSNGSKGGHGFNVVMIADDHGVPIARLVTRMHDSEKEAALAVVAQYQRNARKFLPAGEVGVISADAAFAAHDLRQACRSAGLIENIHEVSHGDKEVSKRRAKKFRETDWPIQGYPSWKVNAHRELSCACGQGTQERAAWIDPDGTARVRLKGRCKTCKTVTLLSGQWRRVQNPDRFVPMQPGDAPEHADWSLGNPLTFNDRMAARFGKKRWVRGEGVHGILKSSYKLNAARIRYRNRRQLELEMNIDFAIILSLAIQQREHLSQIAAAVGIDQTQDLDGRAAVPAA